MGVPIVFAAFILFLLAFQYKLTKNSRQDNRLKKAFWDAEESSLFARKAPIADSDWIHPNSQILPTSTIEEFIAFGRPELYELQEACFTLSKQPMLDLSHMLNSEVRSKYGASQLKS
ncbi:MAG: hypothetical protein H7X94_00390, partial [Vallitaleaceae bacterium]|nr:hypothetical protein [Vallitaleaceae bacterium]